MTSNIQILPLTIKNISRIMSIENEVQAYPWTKGVLVQSLSSPKYNASGIWKNNILLAYVFFSVVECEEAHLENLAVAKNYWRLGFATQLINFALKEISVARAKIFYLEVAKTNLAAQNLYLKLGFEKIGERVNYYCRHKKFENALVYAKNL